MVFRMTNTWCSKHGEDIKNLIKTLIWNICIVGLRYRIVYNARYIKQSSLYVFDNWGKILSHKKM